MGLMDFLYKAHCKLEEYTPKMMEYADKAEERAEKRQQEREQQRQTNQVIINEYKSEFSALSDQELVDIVRSNARFEKEAALQLLRERGYSPDDDNVWRKNL